MDFFNFNTLFKRYLKLEKVQSNSLASLKALSSFTFVSLLLKQEMLSLQNIFGQRFNTKGLCK